MNPPLLINFFPGFNDCLATLQDLAIQPDHFPGQEIVKGGYDFPAFDFKYAGL